MEIGSEWNGWTVEKYLGEGSFGKVYKIVKEEFGYKYESALKVIRIPQNAGQLAAVKNEGMDDKSVDSYFYSVVQGITSEFALMSQLSGNSNIVSYEDHSVSTLEGEFGWDIFLRMELVTPLYEYLHDRTLTVNDVVQMGIDICKALEVCQQNKVIHRDIKPDNIFYSKQGTYKLGDFGIARKLEKMDSGMTKVGTFSFMAPEVYKGQPYDSTVDIYSLGLILYQFLNNNRRPFMPFFPDPILYSDNEDANLRRMTGEPMPAPVNAGPELSRIVLKAASYDPKDRYSKAYEMKEDLEKVLRSGSHDEVIFPYQGADIADLKNAGDDPYLDETVTMFGATRFPDAHINETRKEDFDEEPETDEAAHAPEASSDQSSQTEHVHGIRKEIVSAVLVAVIAASMGIYSYFNHEVPKVEGVTAETAEEMIKGAGLRYDEGDSEFSDDVPRGSIVTQSVAAGSKVRQGTSITVITSRGKAVKCPDFTGLIYSKAKKKAERAGLLIEADEKKPSEYSDDVAKGCIIRQDIKAGTGCEEGTIVTVVKSKGIEQVRVPDVSGKTQEDAEKTIRKAGLKAATVTQYDNYITKGLIISQSAEEGMKIDKGSLVTIYVSAGPRPVTRSYSSSTSNKSTSKKTTSKKTTSKKKTGTKHAIGKKL